MARQKAKYIVDTSVWIDFFKGQLPSTLIDFIEQALPLSGIVITDIIYHEILVGALNKKEYSFLKEHFSLVERLDILHSEWDDFCEFSWGLYRKGLPGKYNDMAIAFLSHSHACPIISRDKYFFKLSQKKILRAYSPESFSR